MTTTITTGRAKASRQVCTYDTWKLAQIGRPFFDNWMLQHSQDFSPARPATIRDSGYLVLACSSWGCQGPMDAQVRGRTEMLVGGMLRPCLPCLPWEKEGGAGAGRGGQQARTGLEMDATTQDGSQPRGRRSFTLHAKKTKNPCSSSHAHTTRHRHQPGLTAPLYGYA